MQTGRIFAVKQAHAPECGAGENQKFLSKLQEEVRICQDLRHPNIVSYLGHDYSDGSLFIKLEYVPGGSLASLVTEFGALTGHTLRQTTRGLSEGLEYLHTRNPPVVHRDIKGANVLVDLNFRVKLADFGCSRQDASTQSFTTIGSIPWMAPEVISQAEGYGRKADIWSLGCTIIEAASAEKPWGNKTFDNVINAMRQIAMSDATPPIPEAAPWQCRHLMESCLQRPPDRRPSATQLLSHPFIAEL